MTKTIGIVLVIGLVVVVGGIFLLSGDSAPGEGGGTVSSGILDLTFQDYEGNEVKLRDLADRPLILNSWAAWCPFCVKELPAFGQVQAEFGDEVLIVAINRSESLSTARSYTDNLGVTGSMLFLLDSSDSFYRAIAGFSMPETLFVDRDGVVQVHKRGPMEVEEIREKVRALLN